MASTINVIHKKYNKEKKMARSSWKGPYTSVDFIKKPITLGTQGKTNKQKVEAVTYSRSAVISKEWVGLTLGVHNGKSFLPVLILPAMVGRKLGEFSRTRLKPAHPVKKLNTIRGNKK